MQKHLWYKKGTGKWSRIIIATWKWMREEISDNLKIWYQNAAKP